MSFWSNFAQFIWVFLCAFVFIAYLFVLFSIFGDLFRDRKLSGWWKAVWIIFLLFAPFITALVYLIARGKGMAERSAREVAQVQRETDSYIQQIASASPSDEITRAKALLDSGAITQSEYDAIKARALA